jgi:hypothetical protein
MTEQENKPEKETRTPFESAEDRMVVFVENFVQAHMWSDIGEKLVTLQGKEDPDSMSQRFLIENFMSEAIKTIPSLNAGEA